MPRCHGHKERVSLNPKTRLWLSFSCPAQGPLGTGAAAEPTLRNTGLGFVLWPRGFLKVPALPSYTRSGLHGIWAPPVTQVPTVHSSSEIPLCSAVETALPADIWALWSLLPQAPVFHVQSPARQGTPSSRQHQAVRPALPGAEVLAP